MAPRLISLLALPAPLHPLLRVILFRRHPAPPCGALDLLCHGHVLGGRAQDAIKQLVARLMPGDGEG